LQTNIEYEYKITLTSKNGAELEYKNSQTIVVKTPDRFPLVRTISDPAVMTYNTGQIRLGGPIIAEYGEGIILQTSGKIGSKYRIRLDRKTDGFISEEDVEVLPFGARRPGYFIRSLSAAPEGRIDIVRIPYPQNVPYAVIPEPELKRIRIALYGVRTTSTWITHRDSLQVIDHVNWEQTTPETYTVLIHLNTANIWGYELKKGTGHLAFSIKHPPAVTPDSTDRSLKGLKIAIEAGHGGRNTGAHGLSGLLEKDINLDVALRLDTLCRSAGMGVIQVRPDDRYMTLGEKRRIIEDSNADLALSIHANASGTRYGYLGVSGTSTYYHNPFWSEYAGFVYRRLLELPLDEFGMVGSFNYKVIRISSQPVILVEQAFLSHAEDEEKLASAEFREELAGKIFLGIKDYLHYMLGK
jgi:N-acetylmuramoyl-L-alanine amidase